MSDSTTMCCNMTRTREYWRHQNPLIIHLDIKCLKEPPYGEKKKKINKHQANLNIILCQLLFGALL